MDIKNRSTQIILTSISIFLFFLIIIIIYRTNKKCKIKNNRSDRSYPDRYENKEKYEEVNLLPKQDKDFLDKNVFQSTGLGIKDYEYLVNYPNGKGSFGEWSWGTDTNKNYKGYSIKSDQNKLFKERNINNLFKF
jgi:hypothetical protein